MLFMGSQTISQSVLLPSHIQLSHALSSLRGTLSTGSFSIFPPLTSGTPDIPALGTPEDMPRQQDSLYGQLCSFAVEQTFLVLSVETEEKYGH